MTNAQGGMKECPNCHAALPRAGRLCTVCKLEIAKMPAFAAAKRAAQKKGLTTTKIVDGSDSLVRRIFRPIFIVPGVLVLLVVIFLLRPAGASAASKLPTSPVDVTKAFLANISTGQDANYDVAYALISPSVRNPKMDDEIGHYRQLFDVMNHYLSGEFGSDWGSTVTLEVDKGDPDLIIAHVGLETLHIRTVEEKLTGKAVDPNHHYAVAGVDEFDVHDSGKYAKSAVVNDVLGGLGGQGAVDNLATALSEGGPPLHESAMGAKVRLMPEIRNPRTVNNFELYQTWEVRTDPVVRHRLEEIKGDGRYTRQQQEIANEVLTDSVSDEERIAAHLPD